MHVCMCVCMYACVYVCMYVWMDGWMDGWGGVRMCMCVRACSSAVAAATALLLLLLLLIAQHRVMCILRFACSSSSPVLSGSCLSPRVIAGSVRQTCVMTEGCWRSVGLLRDESDEHPPARSRECHIYFTVPTQVCRREDITLVFRPEEKSEISHTPRGGVWRGLIGEKGLWPRGGGWAR